MIYLLDQRHDFRIYLSEIHDKTALIEQSADHDLHSVVVPMQVLALVAIRNQRQTVSGLEPKKFAQSL